MNWQCEKGVQQDVICIKHQIARSFPTACGPAHNEKYCEDRRKSVRVNICTRCVIGTALGLLLSVMFLFHFNVSVKIKYVEKCRVRAEDT